MPTASNFSLADNIIRTKLPTRLDSAGWVTQAAELRALPRIDNGSTAEKTTKLTSALARLEEWEQQIYAHPDRPFKIDSKWPAHGDRTLDFFTQSQINNLRADDVLAHRLLVLVNRMVGFANCKQVAELELNPQFAPVSLPVPTQLPSLPEEPT